MATVDADDDGIQRCVVRRYAHDPLRHERRHQVVAAFDNEQEFRRLLETLAGDLERRRDAGEPIDPLEHYTGLRLEPVYRRRQRDGRVLKEAIRRRVSISDEFMGRLDLPARIRRRLRPATRPVAGAEPPTESQLGFRSDQPSRQSGLPDRASAPPAFSDIRTRPL
jgi:hypothetical protein